MGSSASALVSNMVVPAVLMICATTLALISTTRATRALTSLAGRRQAPVPELVDAAEPWRHQVAELPLIAVRVTEHRLHGVCCPECATSTRAVLSREVPRSAFGPRLQAAVVTLAVRNRVSRRDTTELARELFGVELSTGSVDTIIQRAGAALAGPYTELEQRIKSAPVVNIDETGWKTAGGNRTLWGRAHKPDGGV